jgi:hypothetical protein
MDEDKKTIKVRINKDDLKSLSELMSRKDEDFVKYFDNKDLGYVLSIKNIIGIMYHDGVNTKNDLMSLYDRTKDDKAKSLITEMYAVLQNLENKYFLLNKLYEDRKIG